MRLGKEHWLASAAVLLLSGCGGGGGSVQSTPTPVTSTTTTTTGSSGTGSNGSGTTTPATTPNSINYNDAEYQRSNSASYAGAATAWNAGATGAGTTIAILDTGLTDATGTEFAGRIASASTAVSDSAGYADQDGHGTAVAAVAAAAHNGSDIEGIAFGATVLAVRADSTGSCGTTDGCKFNTGTLATAIDYATQHGAKVINMSLGGSSATTQLKAAIGRATAAGIIVVIAAGNDGDTSPDALAQVASDASANGLVIIAGSHDASGVISTFSDKAGSFGQYYLTALGTSVRSFDNKGVDYYYSGTSFSAPAIAAAVAVLEQAFPKLTAAQVVSLLFSTATDAGDTGVDSVYGHGLLNLVKAFQPSGTLSLAGSKQAVSTGVNAVLSTAMGDATATGAGLAKTLILDSYGRAYLMDLSGTVAHVSQQRPLANALSGNLFVRDQSFGAAHVSFTIARDTANAPWVGLAQQGLTPNGQITSRAVSGTVTYAIDAHTSSGFGFAQSGRRIGDLLDAPRAAGSFLVARAPDDGPGFQGLTGMAMAMRHRLGTLSIEGSAERGTLPAMLGKTDRPAAYTMMSLRAKQAFGPLSLTFGGAVLDEAESVLGARFGAALSGRGASTQMADAGATFDFGGGWLAHGQYRHGWTVAAAGGALSNGRLQTAASSFELGRDRGGVRFGLRYAEPTRVTSGGFALSVPDSYDYDTGAVGYALTRLNLAPSGHERDVEANMGFRLGSGWVDGNLFWRNQPGNIAAAHDDTGVALRYQAAF
ncbi:S8 family peptidase [Sphingomonas nostoxanthinifaciens]|uniref:S8 family peptidase n=1 Tax=Sphingomonas nostoxanthinifaciens TaxID=2872652 RepID=UPI001CC2060F|nr:S8 family serine peptidase [Sphingomonas nostoxanthinifaciens]UAK23595.1 S8 family serine peptidase [Sphingomonas nostoxanthinifaciens]